jgi:1,4-dihydroxy-2-naphthoate octaprenyltransferase
MGEIAVAASFGMLPVVGSFWLQAGSIAGEALLVSLPVSLWVMAVLVMNEIPDITADAATGKRTLVVRLGIRATGWLYMAVQVAAFLMLGLAAAINVIPWAGMILPLGLLLPAAWTASAIIRSRVSLLHGIIWTLTIHGLGTIWLAGLAFATP